MSIIKAAKLVFDYITRDENEKVEDISRAIDHLDLSIEKGSFVAVLGHNGSGKSTFAKTLNGILLPTEGTVWISGMDTADEERIWDVRKTVGMVFQNPDNQIIANVVEEDVGFGPENIGVPTEEIWRRVDESLKAVGMTAYRLKSPNRLSGGQKQRVAIAGVMAMRPECIVLDEPTAMLDPNGRKEVIRTVTELNRQEHITVILITHYMEEVIGADRVIVMDGGKMVMDGTPREIFAQVDTLKKYRLDVPQVTELAYDLKQAGLPMPDCVLSIDELTESLKPLLPKSAVDAGLAGKSADAADAAAAGKTADANAPAVDADASGKTSGAPAPDAAADAAPAADAASFDSQKIALRAEDVNFIYGQGTAFEQYALKNVNFSIEKGSFTAIIGHTGSGKSTLIQHLNGLIRATSGHIYFHGEDIYAEKYNMRQLRTRVGMVFQYPEHQLFEVDVLTDVCFGPKNMGLSQEEAEKRAVEALSMVGLGKKYYRQSPFELSGGQKRRVAIAGVLAMRPEVLVLDEPTAGLDPKGRDEILDQVKALQTEQGMTIVLVSHSMEDVARYADHLIVMSGGEKAFDGTPKEVFRHYRELEKIGLSAPQVTYIVQELREEGAPLSERITTVEEAYEAICALTGADAKKARPAASSADAKTAGMKPAGKGVR